MKSKATYMETLFSGLVPAKLIERFESPGGCKMVRLQITADHRAYKRGEVVETLARSFVRISRRSQFHTFVTTVQ